MAVSPCCVTPSETRSQVSTSGNEAGYRWLRSFAGLVDPRLRVHAVRGLYPYTHLDSTVAPLRPGLVLLNPERVTEAEVPECFDGWTRLWCPPPPDVPEAASLLSSRWITMNVLMLDVDLALVDAGNPALVRLLESHGIAVLPRRLRHSRALGGGFHCVTLDVRREGGLEDYRA